MVLSSTLGYPRIGPRRELKKALESFWSGQCDASALAAQGKDLRQGNWIIQRDAGIDHVPSNDFSLYDHVLDTACMVGAIPSRYGCERIDPGTTPYFAMARGDKVANLPAMEMTKWFDTNYHYIVPEFERDQKFHLNFRKPVGEFIEAQLLGLTTRPVLLGPVSLLLLGKAKNSEFDPIDLLPGLLRTYEGLLAEFAGLGAQWIQIDEPVLALDLSDRHRTELLGAYKRLSQVSPNLKILVATYFGDLRDNLRLALHLPVAGLHLDLVRAPEQISPALDQAPKTLALSLGLIDGRNVWKTEFETALETAERAVRTIGPDRVILAPSCSLLFSPVDLDFEKKIDPEIKAWMAFAKQKVSEVATITRAINQGRESVAGALNDNRQVMAKKRSSPLIHDGRTERRLNDVSREMETRRSPYVDRRESQTLALKLPPLPTTTIGSFAQTDDIRAARSAHRAGKTDATEYHAFLQGQIERAIRFQEHVGLDVLVHGEAERNDMVEYFGERLNGFLHTQNGWVQSYGSRCVKPPVIFGDVSRPAEMTVSWWKYAQSLTPLPVKGMLTGPVTILQWSFVRNDQPRSRTCEQIALAIRDEVTDLEREGAKVIQIDEPAIREGLPLRRTDWPDYLKWAVRAFRLSSSGVRDETQIHTHMCYSEFNDIIDSIAAMDADVISIETSRSQMELLDAFAQFRYPNEIGPGVYDIHSPRIPSPEEMKVLLSKAMNVIPTRQLWVNPDCGLKTRKWEEIEPALKNMVAVAKELRSQLSREGNA